MAPYLNTRAAVADPEASNAAHRRPFRKRAAKCAPAHRKSRQEPPQPKMYCECGCDSDSPLTDIDSDSEMEVDVLGSAPMAGPPVASSRNIISQRDQITTQRQVSPHGAAKTQPQGAIYPVSQEVLAKLPAAEREAYERMVAESQNWECNSEALTETPRATPDPDDPDVPTIDVPPFVHRRQNKQGEWVGRLFTKVVDREALDARRRKGRTLGRQGTEILEDP